MGLIKKSRMSAMRATLDLSMKAISSLETSQTEFGKQMAYFELNAYLNLAQRMSWGTLARKIRKALDAAHPGGQDQKQQEVSEHVAEEG